MQSRKASGIVVSLLAFAFGPAAGSHEPLAHGVGKRLATEFALLAHLKRGSVATNS